jgi:hypothetical protein
VRRFFYAQKSSNKKCWYKFIEQLVFANYLSFFYWIQLNQTPSAGTTYRRNAAQQSVVGFLWGKL